MTCSQSVHNRLRLHSVPEYVQRYSWLLWNSFRIEHTDIQHYFPQSEWACVPRFMRLWKSHCSMPAFQMNAFDLVSLATQLFQGNWLILWNCRARRTVHFSSPHLSSVSHTQTHTKTGRSKCNSSSRQIENKFQSNFHTIKRWLWSSGQTTAHKARINLHSNPIVFRVPAYSGSGWYPRFHCIPPLLLSTC